MAKTIHRLVYCSAASEAAAVDGFLQTLLTVSRRNNHRDGLTGALAAHQGRFVQVLEGEPAALDRLLERLAADPRHRDLVVLGRGPCAGRLFDLWTMASAEITPDLAKTLDAIMDEATPSPARTTALLLQAVSHR